MKFRIFKKPPEISGENDYLVFEVSKNPLSSSVFGSNDIKLCYNYITERLGRVVQDSDLVFYSERM